jgi:hypothetical protein
MKQPKTLPIDPSAPKAVGLRRLVSLGHVATWVAVINATALIMSAMGQVDNDTLSAALYWPWVTFVMVAITSSKPKANAPHEPRGTETL